MSDKRQVVVTGLGVVSAQGMNETALWESMMAGRTGIRRITLLDITDYKCKSGAEIDTPVLSAALQAKKIPASDRTVDMALLASDQALESAGLLKGEAAPAPQPVPVIFGTGVGPNHSLFSAYQGYFQKGIRGVRPTTVPRGMTNTISAQISMRFRLTGPNYVIVSACSSATTAIGIAFRMIRDGYADRVLCGGADAPFDPFVYAAWNNLGVMSKNPDPSKACRPFDSARDGCVLGEGAGALILESLDSARQRNARIRGEIVGFGESSDAGHITTPSAEGQARAMQAALDSARLGPDDVGFINAHGTATRTNDECESRSIRMVFGKAADRIPVVSNKSALGHTLGAAGALETIAALLSLERRTLPPNLNLDNPDPACTLHFVHGSAVVEAPVAVKNNFGFGGGNAVLALRRTEQDR